MGGPHRRLLAIFIKGVGGVGELAKDAEGGGAIGCGEAAKESGDADRIEDFLLRFDAFASGGEEEIGAASVGGVLGAADEAGEFEAADVEGHGGGVTRGGARAWGLKGTRASR